MKTRKIISILFVLILVLSLISCGKSKDAAAAEKAISEIGEVTLDSEESILNAEKLFNILTDKEKESVENRIDLINARETFDKLAEQKRIEEEELAEKLKLQEEYTRLSKAVPEMQKMTIAFEDSVLDDLEFVAKYAGNVNGRGSRAFASSFTDRMAKAYDNIDLGKIDEADPEIGELAHQIVRHQYEITDMVIQMGITNSDKDVSLIKQTSLDTIDLIAKFTKKVQELIDHMVEINNTIDN